MLQFRQIQALHAVMVTGTVTQAAAQLKISQPAVSNLINSLEHQVGFSLFDRIRGRLRPTPEADRLFDEIDNIVRGLDRVTRTAGDISGYRAGHLRIACMPALSLSFVPDLIGDFVAEKPDLSITLQTRSSPKVQELVAADLFDIVIVELPVEFPGVAQEAMAFPCLCVMPAGHRLAVRKQITPADLDGEPFISLGNSHMTYHRVRECFSEAGAHWNVRIQSHLFVSACAMVRRGLGVTLADPFTFQQFEGTGLVARPFRPKVAIDLAVIYASEKPRSRLVSEFVGHAIDAMTGYLETDPN